MKHWNAKIIPFVVYLKKKNTYLQQNKSLSWSRYFIISTPMKEKHSAFPMSTSNVEHLTRAQKMNVLLKHWFQTVVYAGSFHPFIRSPLPHDEAGRFCVIFLLFCFRSRGWWLLLRACWHNTHYYSPLRWMLKFKNCNYYNDDYDDLCCHP